MWAINGEQAYNFRSILSHNVQMFAAFCGLGIHNVVMYERIFRAMAKQKVVLDVLSYHASASEEDATKLCVSLKHDTHLNSMYIRRYLVTLTSTFNRSTCTTMCM